MTPEVIDKLEFAFSIGCTDLEACLHAGINKQTLYNYQEKNPDFVDRKELLKQSLIFKSRSIVLGSLQGNDIKTAQWYLERRAKNEFAQRQEQTGPDGEPFRPVKIIITSEPDDDSEIGGAS